MPFILGHSHSGVVMKSQSVLSVVGLALSVGCSAIGAAPALPNLSCDPPRTFADGKTPTAVRHVATGGDDSADGSAEHPFQSIHRALRDVTPGTAVHIHAGTYTGGLAQANLRGTTDAPVWIMGAPGEPRPTIRGGRQGLYLTRPRYLVLQNLEIADTDDNGINVDDGEQVTDREAARFIIFRDLDIHDTGRNPSGVADCLKLAGVNDFFVINSRFARCGLSAESGAVGVGGVGTHHGVVSGSVFQDTGFGGVQFKGGASDIDIIGNRFEAAGSRAVNMGGRTGGQFFRPALTTAAPNHEAARIDVTGNVIVASEAAAAFVGCIDCAFTRNTVINPSKWTLRILQETVSLDTYAFAPASRGIVAGNTFYFRRADLNAGEDINVGDNTDSSSFALTDNAFYAHDTPELSRPVLPTFRGNLSRSVLGVAPAFVNEGAGDFRVPQSGDAFPPGAPASCAIGSDEPRIPSPAPAVGHRARARTMPPVSVRAVLDQARHEPRGGRQHRVGVHRRDAAHDAGGQRAQRHRRPAGARHAGRSSRAIRPTCRTAPSAFWSRSSRSRRPAIETFIRSRSRKTRTRRRRPTASRRSGSSIAPSRTR